ncbi:MAG: hypothetical protein VW446_09400 [Alphaproteobacteria bacterium]
MPFLGASAKRMGNHLMAETDTDQRLVCGMGAAQEFHERGDPVEIIIDAGSRAGDEITVEIIHMRWQLAIHDSNCRKLKVGGAGTFEHGAEHLRIAVELVGYGLVDTAGFQNRDMHGGVLRNGSLPVLNVRLSI